MTITLTWPSIIPNEALAEGYSETLQRNVSSFQPDAGAAIERRRSSTTMTELSYTTVPMDDDEWDALLAFFSDDTKSGVLPFNMVHPRTGDDIIARFTAAPQINAVVGASSYKIAIQIMVLG